MEGVGDGRFLFIPSGKTIARAPVFLCVRLCASDKY